MCAELQPEKSERVPVPSPRVPKSAAAAAAPPGWVAFWLVVQSCLETARHVRFRLLKLYGRVPLRMMQSNVGSYTDGWEGKMRRSRGRGGGRQTSEMGKVA